MLGREHIEQWGLWSIQFGIKESEYSPRAQLCGCGKNCSGRSRASYRKRCAYFAWWLYSGFYWLWSSTIWAVHFREPSQHRFGYISLASILSICSFVCASKYQRFLMSVGGSYPAGFCTSQACLGVLLYLLHKNAPSLDRRWPTYYLARELSMLPFSTFKTSWKLKITWSR